MSTVIESPLARDLARMRRRFRRMWDDPFAIDLRFGDTEARTPDKSWWTPTVEMSESPTEFVVTAELPGISPEAVEVQVGDGVLTIKGTKSDERKAEDKERRYHVWEREYGAFERTFRFPVEVDESKVEATHANGVLRIKVPKSPDQPPARRTVPIGTR